MIYHNEAHLCITEICLALDGLKANLEHRPGSVAYARVHNTDVVLFQRLVLFLAAGCLRLGLNIPRGG